MIAYLKGIISFVQDESIVMDVNGVGYEVICANPFAFQSMINKEIVVNTYHYVREDMQVLYGFKNEDEKYLFTKLISVSGIGPKGALAILGSVDIQGFVAAIEREDDKFLTSFPGVGKKTARQIILDLKGKLHTAFSVDTTASGPQENQLDNQMLSEVQEALKSLGYTDKEIKSILPELQKQSDQDIDGLVRKALAMLMKN